MCLFERLSLCLSFSWQCFLLLCGLSEDLSTLAAPACLCTVSVVYVRVLHVELRVEEVCRLKHLRSSAAKAELIVSEWNINSKCVSVHRTGDLIPCCYLRGEAEAHTGLTTDHTDSDIMTCTDLLSMHLTMTLGLIHPFTNIFLISLNFFFRRV